MRSSLVSRVGALLVLCHAVLNAAVAQARQAPVAGIIDAQASYPEGPLFVGEDLLVAEMGADRVSRYSVTGAKQVAFHEPGCGPTALAAFGDGFAVLCHRSAAVVRIDRNGLASGRFTRTVDGVRLRNPNDAAADRRGGVYFSDPGLFSKDVPAQGALVYLSPDGTMVRVADGLWYPNGVYVDTRGRWLYVSEHLAGMVWRYRIGARGALGARELVLDVRPFLDPRGYREAGPDGLEIGPDGRLVVALYGAGKLLSIPLGVSDARRANGVRVIPTPMAFVTNVAFGGSGRAVTVGPIDNITRPYTGYVMALPPTQSLPPAGGR